jgi:hypothetical protein
VGASRGGRLKRCTRAHEEHSVKQERTLDYERDAAGQILVMQPKMSSLRSSLTLMFPSGDTMDLPIANDDADRILLACSPS